mgnify:CR=1 FL=1
MDENIKYKSNIIGIAARWKTTIKTALHINRVYFHLFLPHSKLLNFKAKRGKLDIISAPISKENNEIMMAELEKK